MNGTRTVREDFGWAFGVNDNQVAVVYDPVLARL
jgi:hypothetical protein